MTHSICLYLVTTIAIILSSFQSGKGPEPVQNAGYIQAPGRIFGPAPLNAWHFTGYAQGTTYHITYYAADSLVGQSAFDSVFRSIDSSLSIYKQYSLISRFNRSQKGIVMDLHLRKVIERSLAICKDSQGSFDITVYPLVNAWGFGEKHPSGMPDSAAIRAILPCVGSNFLHIRGNYLGKSKPCVKIDVNGIAQGYTVDVIARFLENRGIVNYMAEVGGELRVKGRHQPGNKIMQVGIESPSDNPYSEPIVQRVIALPRGAVTTSGNYRKYYESGGKHISHLMNPHTGYPIDNNMISATVVAPDGITADGYDNVLMNLGMQEAMQFMKHHPEMEAYLIYHRVDGTIADTATTGFYKMIVGQ